MTQWTHDEIGYIQNYLNLSTKELYLQFCNEYGSNTRSYNSIQKKIKLLREAYSEDSDEDDEEGVTNTVNDWLNTPTSQTDLFINNVTSVARKEKAEKARWWLEGVIDLAEEVKESLQYQSSTSVVTGDKSTLCVLLSDTHYGKHTKWFDLETARARMRSIPQTIYASATPEIDEVVLILAGDMVEGEDIYPTQNNHIECSAIEQVQACVESLWETILIFREMYEVPVRIETCPGNHGRVSKTANEKTNWDNVIYHMLRVMAAMKDDKNIIVNCNFESFRTFTVKDKTGLAYHQGVKHTSTPATREKIAGWVTSKKFDFMVHGHWHEWHVGNWLSKLVVANGCMCGPDDLAERMGKEDTARQAYFFVTPGQPVHGFSFVEWPDALD